MRIAVFLYCFPILRIVIYIFYLKYIESGKNNPNAIFYIRVILLYLAFLNVENTPALTPAASALARAI